MHPYFVHKKPEDDFSLNLCAIVSFLSTYFINYNISLFVYKESLPNISFYRLLCICQVLCIEPPENTGELLAIGCFGYAVLSGILFLMKNQEIAGIFNEIADLLEIKGENPFRIRAYRRAALNIESLSRDVAETPKDDLMEVPGIGRDLADKIEEYVRTGSIHSYEELKKEIPGGLGMLLSVPGLGPKTAKLFYETLHIKDINELERFAREHKLSKLPGIREKTEEHILKGIEMLKRGRERQPLGKVLPLANDILEHLRKKAPVDKLSIAGSIRRWKDTVKDIDILATSKDPKSVMNAFVHLPQAKEVIMHGPTKSSVIINEGLQVDLRVVEEDSFGAALAYFTGSKAHNIRLREMAVKAGLKINEYGIFREKENEKLGGKRKRTYMEYSGSHISLPSCGKIQERLTQPWQADCRILLNFTI